MLSTAAVLIFYFYIYLVDIAICMNICLIINSILSAWEQPGQGDDGNRVHGKDHSGTHSGRLDGDAHAHKDEQGVTQL